jgi:hypothetical protein
MLIFDSVQRVLLRTANDHASNQMCDFQRTAAEKGTMCARNQREFPRF